MNQLPPVLISTDFDGTLVLDYTEKHLAPNFFAYLSQLRAKRRVVWVINTGREWESLGRTLDSMTLPFYPDWLALQEREIYRIRERELISLEYWNKRSDEQHEDLFRRATPALEKLRKHIDQTGYAETIEDPGSPFGIFSKTEQHADLIAEQAQRILADFPDIMLVRNSVYCRFSHTDFHKGSCLQTIATEEGIAKENCFAVGDHLNDLHMLNPRYAGYIACPGNSAETVKQEVREHSGYVSKGLAADGVVEALEHYFGK